MQMQIQLHSTEEPPWYYGLTYIDYRRGLAICHPVPINLIVRSARYVWFRLKHPKVKLCGKDCVDMLDKK